MPEMRDLQQTGRLRPWVVACAAAVGALIGVAGFTFVYGDGAAYLSDDPQACTNCHVMQGHFDSWQKSSHRDAAVCNDCHLPPGFVGKWITKADNGLLHSIAFTTGDFPRPIRIKPRNARRTQQACLECHGDLVHALSALASGDTVACVRCHGSVGHALR